VRSVDGTLKTQSVTLAAGEEQRLRFQAQATTLPASSTAARPAAPPIATALPPPQREVPWIAWSVTGVLGASAAVSGLLALSAHSDEKAAHVRQGVTHEDLQAARDKVENRALATDILLAGTIVSAGVSTYLTFRTGSARESQTALLVTPSSLTLRHDF
jgi:hypothetical protein